MLTLCLLHLQGLPAELGLLPTLTVLSADCNDISRVPPALLRGCCRLITLTLHENPITFAVRDVHHSLCKS